MFITRSGGRRTPHCLTLALALPLLVAAASGGCSSKTSSPASTSICQPGSSEGCFGTSGCVGTTTCSADGTTLGSCLCSGAMVDAGHDTGSPDTGEAVPCSVPEMGSFEQGVCEYSPCITTGTPYFCVTSSGVVDGGRYAGSCFSDEDTAETRCSTVGTCIDCTGLMQATIYTPGSPCGASNNGGLSCGSDQGAVLLCGTAAPDAGVLPAPDAGPTFTQVFACPSGQECSSGSTGSAVSCGQAASNFQVSFAIVGTQCTAEGSAACTFDYSEALECQEGVWVLSAMCGTGPAHCDLITPGGTGQGGSMCPTTSMTGCIGCL